MFRAVSVFGAMHLVFAMYGVYVMCGYVLFTVYQYCTFCVSESVQQASNMGRVLYVLHVLVGSTPLVFVFTTNASILVIPQCNCNHVDTQPCMNAFKIHTCVCRLSVLDPTLGVTVNHIVLGSAKPSTFCSVCVAMGSCSLV